MEYTLVYCLLIETHSFALMQGVGIRQRNETHGSKTSTSHAVRYAGGGFVRMSELVLIFVAIHLPTIRAIWKREFVE